MVDRKVGRVREFFKDLGLNFDRVFCSKTKRTIETLGIVIEDFRVRNNVFIDERLCERYHRDLIGLNKEEVEKIVGKSIVGSFSAQLYFEGTDRSILTDCFKNDEKIEEIEKRVRSFVDDLKKLDEDFNVLIVGHSIFNQYLLEYLKFGIVGVDLFCSFQENNEIRIVDLDKGLNFVNLESIFSD